MKKLFMAHLRNAIKDRKSGIIEGDRDPVFLSGGHNRRDVYADDVLGASALPSLAYFTNY
jgi:hypothetical protein